MPCCHLPQRYTVCWCLCFCNSDTNHLMRHPVRMLFRNGLWNRGKARPQLVLWSLKEFHSKIFNLPFRHVTFQKEKRLPSHDRPAEELMPCCGQAALDRQIVWENYWDNWNVYVPMKLLWPLFWYFILNYVLSCVYSNTCKIFSGWSQVYPQ